MFFLLIIISIITIIILLVICSSLKLELRNWKISYPKNNNKFLNENVEIYLNIYILGIIKIAKLDLTKLNIKPNKKMEIKKNETDKNVKIIELLKSRKIDIEKINLEATIGFEDAAITAILIGTIYMVISFIIGKKINENSKNIGINKFKNKNKIHKINKKNKMSNSNYKIEITPIYNVNTINAKFECIIKMKLIHIIHVIYILNRKNLKK